ncbi:hypothetical protein ACIPEN_13430 [Herbaspirillum chlorophenolicum]|uniref:Uncharacterized protein n=1 Tax=Herbaspirillum chlorophenolicum TaxID=211589 RepID=A0ABW8F0K9_9BURK
MTVSPYVMGMIRGKVFPDCALQYPIGEAAWIMKNTWIYYQKNVFENPDKGN